MKAKPKSRRKIDRKQLLERQRSYQHTFSLVYDCYLESQATCGMKGYDRFYQRLAREQSNTGGGICTGVGLSDYISDVELAIRAVIKQCSVSDFDELSIAQKERVGKEFMRRKLIPTLYFKKRK